MTATTQTTYNTVLARPLRAAIVMYLNMYQDEIVLGVTGTASDAVLHSTAPIEGRTFHRIAPCAGDKQLEVPSHYTYIGTVHCTEYHVPWSIFASPTRSTEPWPEEFAP